MLVHKCTAVEQKWRQINDYLLLFIIPILWLVLGFFMVMC